MTGSWLLDGEVLPAGQGVVLTPAEFAALVYRGGLASGAETLYVRASDGVTTSAWSAFTATTTGGASIVVSPQSLAGGMVYSIHNVMTFSDPNGRIAVYEFYDGSGATGSARFEINGVAQAATTVISVDAADLGSVTLRGGSQNSSETLYVRFSDGEVTTDWQSFTATTTGGYTVTQSAVNVTAGEGVLATEFVAITDPNGLVAGIEVFDGGTAVTSGHWELNGTALAGGVAVDVALADWASLVYRGGFSSGAESVYVRVFDGEVWTGWYGLTATTTGGASLSVASVSVLAGADVAASSFVTLVDPNAVADTIEIFDGDSRATSGAWYLDGVEQAAGTPIALLPSQFGALSYRGGFFDGYETLYVRLANSSVTTNWQTLTATTTGGATLSVQNMTVGAGQSRSPSAFMTLSDPNGVVQGIDVFDGGSASTSGYFTVGGVVQASGTAIALTPATLDSLGWHAGSVDATETLYVRLRSATVTTSWYSLSAMTVNGYELAIAPLAVNAGETVAAESIVSFSDPGGVVQMLQVYDGNSAATSGYWSLDGVVLSAGAWHDVAPAALTNVTFTGGFLNTTETLYVRAWDGHVWTPALNAQATTSGGLQLSIAAVSRSAGAEGLVTDFVTASDPNGVVSTYELYDSSSSATSGCFLFDGAKQAAGTALSLSPTALATATWRGGFYSGNETVYVRATNGTVYTPWYSAQATTTDGVVVGLDAFTVVAGADQPGFGVGGVAQLEDPNGLVEAIDLYDGNGEATGGFWTINGVRQSASTAIAMAPADLATVAYRGGLLDGSETVYVRARNSEVTTPWVARSAATIGGVDLTQRAFQIQLGETASLAPFVGDPQGVLERVELYKAGGTAGSGTLTLDGIAQAVNTAIPVDMADLQLAEFVGAATTRDDLLYLRLVGNGITTGWYSFPAGSLDKLALDAADSDADTLSDWFETRLTNTNPTAADSDANGTPDGAEDAESDGLDNAAEQAARMNPLFAATPQEAAGVQYPAEITALEDAEDGNTFGWKGFDTAPGGTLANVVDPDDAANRAISLAGSGLETGWRFTLPAAAGVARKLNWRMRFGGAYELRVRTLTTRGVRDLRYTAAATDALGDGWLIDLGLGASTSDGAWHSIRRDLQADLYAAQPGVDILSVLWIDVRGSGLLDDLSLLAYPDFDRDLLPDAVEIALGLDPIDPSDAHGDLDGDGIDNLDELLAGTLEAGGGADSDGDGMDDAWELAHFGDLTRDGSGDYDDDGLSDLEEFSLGSDPTNIDTDGDGLWDGFEVAHYLQLLIPAVADSGGTISLYVWSPLE